MILLVQTRDKVVGAEALALMAGAEDFGTNNVSSEHDSGEPAESALDVISHTGVTILTFFL